jgi:hypothetical protein
MEAATLWTEGQGTMTLVEALGQTLLKERAGMTISAEVPRTISCSAEMGTTISSAETVMTPSEGRLGTTV